MGFQARACRAGFQARVVRPTADGLDEGGVGVRTVSGLVIEGD